MDYNIGSCKFCNKKLRDFKKTADWSKRKYHKKCWFIYTDFLSMRELYENLEKI